MDREQDRFTPDVDAYPAPGNPEAPYPGAKSYPTAIWAVIVVIGLLFALALLGLFIMLGNALAS